MEKAKTVNSSPALLAEISIQTLGLVSKSILVLSTLSSHPLFSMLATFSLLAFLYLPRQLLPFFFSPVSVSSTLLILAALLRLVSPAPKQPVADEHTSPPPENKLDSKVDNQETIFSDAFLHWSFRSGPLEVIYEEYEGEEEEEDRGGESPESSNFSSRRLQSFGFDYTDSDTESDGSPFAAMAAERWESPENLCFRWDDEEEEEDGLIEITLEEDNLIEIDISGSQ